MNDLITNLDELLRSLEPERHEGAFVFCSLSDSRALPRLRCVGQFLETEGVTVILSEEDALQEGLEVLFRAAWITLKVHSDLSAVGLTAAVAGALAARQIPCNVVAAAFHDHLFVPIESAEAAIACLKALQVGERQSEGFEELDSRDE